MPLFEKCIQDSTYFLKKSQKKILVRLKFSKLQSNLLFRNSNIKLVLFYIKLIKVLAELNLVQGVIGVITTTLHVGIEKLQVQIGKISYNDSKTKKYISDLNPK